MGDLLNFSLINIDKPAGPTSFQISEFIKKSLNLKKTSHMGTLDPQVTGVLPITLGRACKLSDYFMHHDKTYIGIMSLHEKVPDKKLNREIENFIGRITQLPPVRSSVKRAERVREVKTLKILEIDGKNALFETQVEAGTYIRKLVYDLGKNIGGAHMLELRRTKAGIFDELTAITLYEFEKATKENYLDKYLVPAEDAIIKVLPSMQLKEDSLKQLLTGKPLMKSDIKNRLPRGDVFAAFLKERFVGVYKKTNEEDIIARAKFVYN